VTSPAAPRHKPGRGSEVGAEERRAIQAAHLVEGLNQTRLAARFGRRREAIARVLKGEEFEALRRDVLAEVKATAKAELERAIVPAAKAWGASLDVAARKGDHKPAKDLLLHTDVIQPLGEESGCGVVVNIGIALPGLPGS
jgi:hypothetical protein